MADAVTFRDYYQLLSTNTNFRKLWFAQVVSELGDWIYTIAIYSTLLQATGGKAVSISVAFIFQELPQFLVSPLAGVINDRLSRRKVMIAADWARVVIVLLMLVAQNQKLIWFIYVLLFLETVCWAMFEPARGAVIPNVTRDEKEKVAANSLASATWSFNFAMGFSVGGFLAAFVGVSGVFLINALTFVVSAMLIMGMKFDEPHVEAAAGFRFRDLADFTPMIEGVRYVARDVRLFALMLLKFGLGFMGANWVILTMLGERKYAVGAVVGMSILMASRGLGAIIGPLVSARIAGANEQKMRIGLLFAFAACALGYMGLSFAPSLWLACLSLILAHAGGSSIWVFSSTMLQSNTDDKFRGRVFSAEFAFMTISMTISSAVSGVWIDRGLSPERMAFYAGLFMLVPMVAWWFAMRLWREPAIE